MSSAAASAAAGAPLNDLEEKDTFEEMDTFEEEEEDTTCFASCKFQRSNCVHPLFRREYMRSNRKRKTKILRCFPHCCPAHFPRCYCGCALHVLVTFKDAASLYDEEIVVCARFEPATAAVEGDRAPLRKLARGEDVMLPLEVLQPAAPQDSIESPWVRAYKESASKQQSLPDRSALYVLNNHRFPKWYYGYESGATKSQRERKHHLRVYVLRLGQPCGAGTRLATVLARHASPSFTIVSYRRAGAANRAKKSSTIYDDETSSSGRRERRRRQRGSSSSSDTDSSEGEESATALERKLSQLEWGEHRSMPRQAGSQGSDVDTLNRNSHNRCDLEHESHHSAEGILLGLRYSDHTHGAVSSAVSPEYPCSRRQHRPQTQSSGDSRAHRIIDEKLFWRQSGRAQTLQHARELAVLQYFITHVSMDELWGPVLNLEKRLWRFWIEPLHNETRDTQSRELMQRFCLPIIGTHDPRQISHDRDELSMFSVHPVLGLCAEVAVEFVTSRELQDLLRIALQSTDEEKKRGGHIANVADESSNTEAPGESAAETKATRETAADSTESATTSDHLRKSVTRERFAALVDGVHAHLNALLTRSRRMTIGALVDDLMTLVHQSQRLRWLQPVMREVLGMEVPDRVAFGAFCAQRREASIAQRSSPATRTRMLGMEIHSGARKPPGRWSRRWLLDARLLRFVSSSSSDPQRHRQQQWQQRGDLMNSHAFRFVRGIPGTTALSAWELLSTVQQFGAVDLEVDTSASLRMRSALRGAVLVNEDNDHESYSQPMHLRLDGKYRVFRTFPSGMSTMAVTRDGWVFGDYFGHLESAVSIKVWAFAYQSENGGGGEDDGGFDEQLYGGGMTYGGTGAPTFVRCIAVHMRLQPPPGSSTLHLNSGENEGEADRLVVSVKVDDAVVSGPRDVGLESGPGVRGGEVVPDLRFLSGAERHELWKTLHWRTSSEFEVEYQHISS